MRAAATFLERYVGMGSAPRIPIAILVIWLIVLLFAPLLAPWPQGEIIGSPFEGPSTSAWLGTDYFGRDILSRILMGAQVTLLLALLANILSSAVGITLGFVAAYAKGWVDDLISRLVDGLLAFPTIMFALICLSAFGSSNVTLVFTIGFIEAIRVFRVARAVAADNLTRDYVDLAHLRGESVRWILLREVVPNSYPPLLTDFGIRFAATIILVSSISFLGLGVQPPLADWGMMTRENIPGLQLGALAPIYPALAIFSVTYATNKLVDWYLERSQSDIPSELLS